MSESVTLSIREALNRTLHHEMARDARVICIGEDIAGGADSGHETDETLGGVFGVTKGLANRFGRARVIDTPISETAFLGMGIGAAMTGLRPVVEIMFCDFLGVCFDQLMNQAAKARFLSGGRMHLPLTVRTTIGAGDGSGAMHSASLHGLLAGIAGLTVACPATAQDAAGLLAAAIRGEGPVVLMEHKGLYDHSEHVPSEPIPIPFGKGRLVREGKHVTIVATSASLHRTARLLDERGINADLIDPRTIVPLDSDLICASVEKTGRLLVVDEGPETAGFADMVIAAVAKQAFNALKKPPISVCPPGMPVPYARPAEKSWLPNVDRIAAALHTLLNA